MSSQLCVCVCVCVCVHMHRTWSLCVLWAACRVWSRIHLVHLHRQSAAGMKAGCCEPAAVGQLTGHISASLCDKTLTQEDKTQTSSCPLSFLLCPTTLKAFGPFYGSFKHTMGVLFGGITLSLYHLLSITPSVSVRLCCIYCITSLSSSLLLPVFPNLCLILPSHFLQSHQHVLALSDVFSHLFFTTPSISFSPLFTHLSPVTV